MSRIFKLASNLAPLSRISDRFVSTGYTEDVGTLEEKLELMADIDGIDGVGLGYPCPPLSSGAAVRTVLDRYGLAWGVSDADIYTESRFKLGSLSNPDAAVRTAAMDRIKECIDGSVEGGAASMNLWLGHDGFDYTFQGNYSDAWKWILEGLAQIAEYNTSDMPVCIEPKCKEPRGNSYIANTGKALWILEKIGSTKMGLTLDFGHSLGALEQPAEVAVLAMREGWLKQVHLNDNRRDWDLDLIPGSVTVWEHVEFFYWLRKLGYEGWMSLDIFPYRAESGVEVIRTATKVCRACEEIADQLLAEHGDAVLGSDSNLMVLETLWEKLRTGR